MKISIIHPSRNRPKEAFETACKWRDNADLGFEYILSLDNDDNALSDYLKLFDNFGNTAKGCTYDNKSAIEAINKAAKIATGDLLIVISDDFDCFPHWDTLLISAIHWDAEKLFMQIDRKTDFIVKTQDGLQKTLITLPIMDRIYYERFGYIYHPDYVHMFSDQEMTAVGHMLGKIITVDLEFNHLHYTTGKSAYDEINRKNDATWSQGEALFNERLKTNFGIENPVIPYSSIEWK